MQENSLEELIDKSLKITSIDDAIKLLFSIYPNNDLLDKSLDISIKAHENDFRKSGEPYAIHPIIVASYVAFLSGDKILIASALLHDVIEDSDFDKEYISENISSNIASIVQGLTNIKSIDKKETKKDMLNVRNLFSSNTKYSDKIIFIKLCDRLHNMLTLDSMPNDKQIKKSRETMSIYAPIAHRLGMSMIKNMLEDLSFKYLFPKHYDDISDTLDINTNNTKETLNILSNEVSLKMQQHSFTTNEFEISSRIKHKYSIHLKQQRKNMESDEVFDILAIRILVNSIEDCYKVLGIIHTSYHPIMKRFKDYIATPKENGYETIHTTILNKSVTCEMQIRTFDMHKTAEFGIASHWKYKELSSLKPSLSWIENLSLKEDIDEFHDSIEDGLKIDTIDVYSSKHEKFTIYRNATALDFAYKVHNDIGNYAKYAIVNNKQVSLLSKLSSDDTIHIVTDKNKMNIKCSWADMVVTKKAKDSIKHYCKNKLEQIDKHYVFSLLRGIFSKTSIDTLKSIIIDSVDIDENTLFKASTSFKSLQQIANIIDNELFKRKKGLSRVVYIKNKLEEKQIDNFLLYSNKKIKKIEYDFCCHPKKGDSIVAFLENKKLYVHNKMCDNAIKMCDNHKTAVFITWNFDDINHFNLIVSLQDKIGALADFINALSKFNISIKTIELGKEDLHLTSNSAKISIDTELDIDKIKKDVLKNFNIVELVHNKDVYL